VDLLVLGVAFIVILVGAELFTNGIEWFGHKLNLAEGAVGSVLAAVGTALPETMIPIVAILLPGAPAPGGHATSASEGVGVGAILGAPFMLATLAMFVTGAAVVAFAKRGSRGSELVIDPSVVGKDVRYFAIAYSVAVLAAFLPSNLSVARIAVAAFLLVVYAIYVREHFIADPDVDAVDLAPLHLHRLDVRARRADPAVPRLRVVGAQVLVALACIVGGAVVFVDAVTDMSTALGAPPAVLALVIAPFATELPEKFNSVIWIRQAKDTLALGNITGAMVFQSCIPTVVGLVFAAEAWTIDLSSRESLVAFASAIIAFVSMAAIFLPMARRNRLTGRGLMIGWGFYLLYLVIVLIVILGVV
jgi:cation:H+ antiporter